jgi:hypothetical protein
MIDVWSIAQLERVISNQFLKVMISERNPAGLQPMHEAHRRPEEILEDVIVAHKEQSRC